MAVIASAPASSIARAIGRTSATLGESLTSSGRSVGPPDGGRDRPGGVPVDGELEPALADVRAADVQLDAGHAGHAVEPPDDLDVVLDRLAGHVDDDRHLPALPDRGVLLDDRVDAGVLEADRVEHPGRRLGDPRRRVADPRLERRALAADRAEALDVDHVAVLDAVAERARGDEDRVGQDEPPPEVDREVDRSRGSLRRSGAARAVALAAPARSASGRRALDRRPAARDPEPGPLARPEAPLPPRTTFRFAFIGSPPPRRDPITSRPPRRSRRRRRPGPRDRPAGADRSRP